MALELPQTFQSHDAATATSDNAAIDLSDSAFTMTKQQLHFDNR